MFRGSEPIHRARGRGFAIRCPLEAPGTEPAWRDPSGGPLERNQGTVASVDALTFKTELEAVLDALAGARVPVALCGGVALGVHGFVRATKDFDFVVPETEVDRAKAAVAVIGFAHQAAPMTFKKGTPEETTVHRVSKAVGDSLLTVDFLLARGFLSPIWDARQLVEWTGRRVEVISAAGLIKMKEVAGRPQDRADIVRLEAVLRGEAED